MKLSGTLDTLNLPRDGHCHSPAQLLPELRNGMGSLFISKSKWRRQHSYGEQLCDACVQFSQPEHNAVVGGDPMNQNREWLLVFHTT